MNAAAREGRYDETLWKEWTGKTARELGEEWNQAIAGGKRWDRSALQYPAAWRG